MAALASLSLAIPGSGCGGDDGGGSTATAPGATTATGTTTTSTTAPTAAGIILDPGLTSATGIPAPDEMKALIALQSQLPYPIIVPTYLPGGYILDTTLMGYGNPGADDPTGYYSFRYYAPGNDILNMTFNQSAANSKPLSGYYLTEVGINGQAYQVYWHKTREYLPAGDPVRTDHVGDAEGFVVVWQGQYAGPDGSPRALHYAITTSTYTGIDWGTMQQIIAGLRPLSAVGG